MMPKSKFKLTKKHEKLIDIFVNIPTLRDISNEQISNTCVIDQVSVGTDAMRMALLTISKGTMYEDLCNDIVNKADELILCEEEIQAFNSNKEKL